MYSVAKEWNPNQKKLSQLLSKPDTFDQAIQLYASKMLFLI